MDSLDIEVRRIIYDGFLAQGAAPGKKLIARLLNLPEPDIDAAFERLGEAHQLVLQPESREVLMANPFSVVPTAFKVTCGTRSWWANCIWDALGVSAMIGQDGVVETSCPDCGEALRLEIKASRLQPAEGLVHFSVPAARWWEDIIYT